MAPDPYVMGKGGIYKGQVKRGWITLYGSWRRPCAQTSFGIEGVVG